MEVVALKNEGFVPLPEIYQVELVGGKCQLRCISCPVSASDVPREKPFFDFQLLKEMVRRGDFDNTFFVELQGYGEPALHPECNEIARFLQAQGLLVGCSTNLLLLQDFLFFIEEVTVSYDDEVYRQNRNEEMFHRNLNLLLTERTKKGLPTHIQVVMQKGREPEMLELYKELKQKYQSRHVLIQMVDDYFTEFDNPVPTPFCINPFFSVSVWSDGEVVACCFDWKKVLSYGNLNNQSLKEIWNGERHKALADRWKTGNLHPHCRRCCLRSPFALHWRFIVEYRKNHLLRIGK